jgi:hypothetical protein
LDVLWPDSRLIFCLVEEDGEGHLTISVQKTFLRNNNLTKTCHNFGTPVGGKKILVVSQEDDLPLKNNSTGIIKGKDE